ESSQLKIPWLQASDLLFESLAEAFQVIGLVRNQETGKLKLIVKSTHIVAPGSAQIESGDVGVVRGTIVIHGRCSNEVFKVGTNPTTNMPGEIASDQVVGVGKAIGKLWRAGIEQEPSRFHGSTANRKNPC